MHQIIDPLFSLQLVITALIVLTLPDRRATKQADEASTPTAPEPFQLSDGNTYVEHAGMAVEAHLVSDLTGAR